MNQKLWFQRPWQRLQSQPKTTISVIGLLLTIIALVVTFFRPGPVHGSPEFDMDPNFGIPRPPINSPIPTTNIIIEQAVMYTSGLIGVALGTIDAYRTKTLLPLLLPISGAFIAFPELMLDVLGGLYHPWPTTTYPSFHLLGREIVPWVSVWFGYGAFMQTLLRLLHNNASTKNLWLFWGLMVLGDLVIEEIFLPMGAWVYYGNQPLRVGSLPWWWLPCNSIGVFLAAAVAFRARGYLRGWKVLFVVFSTPISVAGTYGAIALPCWFAVNGDFGWFVTQMCGLLTMALGLLLFCVILEVVLERNAFEMDGRGVDEVTQVVDEEENYHDYE
ncbi:hypothetical protein D6D12_06481 [Aureobasidium pullulans]|uniref:Uncharacterized protein n=1 Tax=Aureobasidium pullulans TaxID=5580 RepID=A0AB74JP75_AURPU|nr:hypothetical protein D6D12_06481 [Aureobasidium pullulans]THX35798.1 hypothetical protein D6D11_09554 [Aureobasidium pullulans]